LYDLNVSSLGRFNTYEFKFNEKKIVLKPAKLKSNVGNNKEGTVNAKDNEIPCYLVNKSHFSLESPINESTPRSKNSSGIVSLPLGISYIITNESSVPFCIYRMIITQGKRQLAIINISLLQSLTSSAGHRNR